MGLLLAKTNRMFSQRPPRKHAVRNVPKDPDAALEFWMAKLGTYEHFHPIWWESVAALHDLGHDIVPRLIDALANERLSVRWGAEAALCAFGSTILYDAIAALGHDDDRVRKWAVMALFNLAAGESNQKQGYDDQPCPGIGDAVPALIEALEDQSFPARGWVANALGTIAFSGDIGSRAEESVQALIELLTDEKAGVRGSAALALGQLAPYATPAIPMLTRLLLDDVPDVREDASRALDQIRRHAETPRKE
jgi:HEAT repeat protein